MLHDLQKVPTSGHVERAFLMHNRHRQGAAEPVMLGPAFQTWRSLEKLHDKSRNLPDPDIFAFDKRSVGTMGFGGDTMVEAGGRLLLPRDDAAYY